MQTRRSFLGLLAGGAAAAAVAVTAEEAQAKEPAARDDARELYEASEHAVKKPARRLGLMRISNEVLKELFPQGTAGHLMPRIGRDFDYDWLRKALLLPDNTTILDMSTAHWFAYNETAIRIECPDFPEYEQCAFIREVTAQYTLNEQTRKAEFAGWGGLPEPTDAEVERIRAKFVRQFTGASDHVAVLAEVLSS